MNLTYLILRNVGLANKGFINFLPATLIRQKSTKDSAPADSSSSSSSSSESDEETVKKTSSNDAVTRLNTLLQQMVSNESQAPIQLAQPTNKRLQGRKEKEIRKTESVEKDVVKSVKNVAEILGGDTKQTESELLMKLLNPTEGDLSEAKNLSDILKGMKVEREAKPESKAEQVRSVLQEFGKRIPATQRSPKERGPKRPRAPSINQPEAERVNLFGSEPLGIFTNLTELRESYRLKTWQKLQDRDLKLAVTHPPANYFQEMILWTEQGKFWQFPINNEFGLEEESKVYFTEHVFLEEHLEPWCPQKGPIRHFMELVCVGLSKNCYLTVEAKKEHIMWFKNYFEDKIKLLQEVGAYPAEQTVQKAIEKE